ncbi:MAG: hypothetical protein M0R03_03705 [Novosphingobium sp.]|nr:hypothetical protein [Novosphingobium sp.]
MGDFLGLKRLGRFFERLVKGASKDIQKIIKEVGLSDVAKKQVKEWVREYLVKWAFGKNDEIFGKIGKVLLNAKTEIAEKQIELNKTFENIKKPEGIDEITWNAILSEVREKTNEIINSDFKKPVDEYSFKLNDIKKDVEEDINELEKEIDSWVDKIGR